MMNDEADSSIAWLNATLDAASWHLARAITPVHAALLLAGHNPNTACMGDAETSSYDGITPDDYRKLHNIFQCESDPHDLASWRRLAAARLCKVHPWLDQWDDLHRQIKAPVVVRGVPTSEIVSGFKLDSAWHNKLKHWKNYPYLKTCVAQPGTTGKNGSTLWKPHLIGQMLIAHGVRPNDKSVRTTLELKFPGWVDDYNEISGWNDV